MPGWIDRWAVYYADTPPVATALLAVHVLALFVGGGLALATDRAFLIDVDRGHAEWASVRTIVDAMVGEIVLTGLALFLTDITTFIASPAFWAKMAAFLLLGANGARFIALSRAHARGGIDAASDRARRGLRVSAVASAALWCITLLLGVVVGNG